MATRTVSGSPTVSAAELRRARTLLLDQCDATPPEDDLLGDAIVNAAHALEAAARAIEAHDALDRVLCENVDRIFDAQAVVRMVRLAIDDDEDPGHSAGRALAEAERLLSAIAESLDGSRVLDAMGASTTEAA